MPGPVFQGHARGRGLSCDLHLYSRIFTVNAVKVNAVWLNTIKLNALFLLCLRISANTSFSADTGQVLKVAQR